MAYLFTRASASGASTFRWPGRFAITNFVWWVGIGHAGTFISAFLLLLRQKWRTSINRFAEAMTIFAVGDGRALMPILHLGRPWFFYWLVPYPDIMNLWPQWRSPLVWDIFAIGTYIIVSLLFWYMGLIPDLATLRDRAAQPRQADRLRPARARLARRGAALAPLRYGVPADGGPRDAAGDLGAQRRVARLRHRQHARLALDDLPAVLRRRRAVLRLRDGADARDPAARGLRPEGLHHRAAPRQHRPRSCSPCGLIVAYSYAIEIFMAFYSGDQFEIAMTLNRMRGPYAPVYWTVHRCCNVVVPQSLWLRARAAQRRAAVRALASSSTSACGWSAS